MTKDFILASRSPRRREFLASLGIPFSVESPDIPETLLPGESAADYTLRVATEKCQKVAASYPNAAVLAADTTVVLGEGLNEQILAKPDDDADAARMLSLLQGRKHRVLTAFCLRDSNGDELSRVVSSEVEFVKISTANIAAYVATGDPLDKAGAYAIQGGAARFVRSIQGSYTNIVGLPLAEVCEALESFGLLHQNEDAA